MFWFRALYLFVLRSLLGELKFSALRDLLYPSCPHPGPPSAFINKFNKSTVWENFVFAPLLLGSFSFFSSENTFHRKLTELQRGVRMESWLLNVRRWRRQDIQYVNFLGKQTIPLSNWIGLNWGSCWEVLMVVCELPPQVHMFEELAPSWLLFGRSWNFLTCDVVSWTGHVGGDVRL